MSNFGEQINLIINNISQKLGIAAEKLYPALSKQALIDGITGCIWVVIAILVLIFFIAKLIKWFKNPEKTEGYYSELTGLYITKVIITIFIVFICVMIIGINFNSSITALFNPDWYIVNKVIQQLK